MSDAGLFGQDANTGAVDHALIQAYESIGRTLDDLPYTESFEQLFAQVTDIAGDSKADVFHRLQNLRKAGRLPRVGRSINSTPPRIDSDQETRLVELVEQQIGRLSLRDQLLYRSTFDTIVETFNAQFGLGLTHHALWRIIAKLAK